MKSLRQVDEWDEGKPLCEQSIGGQEALLLTGEDDRLSHWGRWPVLKTEIRRSHQITYLKWPLTSQSV